MPQPITSHNLCGVKQCDDAASAVSAVWHLADAAQSSIGIVSRDGFVELCNCHAKAFRISDCQVKGCQNRRGVLFSITVLYAQVVPDIFGIPAYSTKILPGWLHHFPDSDVWWYPHDVFVCQKHFSQIRRKHGTELGYTMRDGQIKRYVKDYYV